MQNSWSDLYDVSIVFASISVIFFVVFFVIGLKGTIKSFNKKMEENRAIKNVEEYIKTQYLPRKMVRNRDFSISYEVDDPRNWSFKSTSANPLNSAIPAQKLQPAHQKNCTNLPGLAEQEIASPPKEKVVSAPVSVNHADKIFLPSKPVIISKEDIQFQLNTLNSKCSLTAEDSIVLTRGLRAFMLNDPSMPRGILLSGPPGAGKTWLAQQISECCGCTFFPIDASTIKRPSIGASGQIVDELWKKAMSVGSAVIFLDECESIVGSRSGFDSDPISREILSGLLCKLSGIQTKVLFVAATNHANVLDSAFVDRMDIRLIIGLPSKEARRKIMKVLYEKYKMKSEPAEEFVNITDGLSARDLDAVIRAARQVSLDGILNFRTAFPSEVKNRRVSVGYRPADCSWDDLILPNDTMTRLKEVVKLMSAQNVLSARGINVCTPNILFCGPPGTGKTQIARVVSSVAGCSFFPMDISDLRAGYLGQTGKKVRAALEEAINHSPSVIFIDEFDAVCPQRNNVKSDSFANEAVSIILQFLDGVRSKKGRILVLSATNNLELVDSAVVNRFELMRVDLPDCESREKILKRKIFNALKVQSREADEISKKIAMKTDGVSGRELHRMVDIAMEKMAVRYIDSPHVPCGILESDFDVLKQR